MARRQRWLEELSEYEAQRRQWQASQPITPSDPGPSGRTCYNCDGTGSIYQGPRSESYSRWVMDSAGVSYYVTGTRWVNDGRKPCTECGGRGLR